MTGDINYTILFRSAPALIMVLKPDKGFTILDASESYMLATKTKRHEMIGKALFEVFPDNPSDTTATGVTNLRNSLLTVLKTKESHTMALQKYDIPLEDGSFEEKYWKPKNMPVLDDDGTILYIIHQVEDVTLATQVEKRIEEETRKANQTIEEKSQWIEENTRRVNIILTALKKHTAMDFSERIPISEKKDPLDDIASAINQLIDELEKHTHLLTITNRDLEYVNKELESFSYSVSHDLRAPLRAVSGYAQVLLEDYVDKIDDYGKQTIDIIIRNAAKMGALIDDLLTFSRLGKQTMTKVPLKMNNLIDIVKRELTEQYKGTPIQWNIKELDNVEGDGSMMAQVMTNLLSNAMKYSNKKENPEIEIGSYKENGSVIYYVKDNGAGFDMRYYNKLFGVFQRLHNSNEYEGTGVGLALVQRIIKKHQGEVWAEAEVEKGATFYIALPEKEHALT